MRRFARIPILATNSLLLLVTAFVVTPAVTHAQSAAPTEHRHSDKQVVAYYTQWSIYGANYFIKNIITSGTASKLTTLDYRERERRAPDL
jgi:chitinase